MILESLKVMLGFEVDRGSKARADAAVEGLSSAMAGLGGALVGEGLRRVLQGLTLDAIELGSAIQDTSDRLGISTGDVQRFTYAVAQTGGSSEDAVGGLRNLSRMLDAAASGSEEAGKAFAGLGVRATDANGKVRPLGDVLPEIVDGFAGLEEGPERAAAAMQIFGKAGINLVPLLSQGSEGFAELYAEAERLGFVLDQKAISALDDASDEMLRMKTASTGLKLAFGAQLAPTFERVFRYVRMEIIPRLQGFVRNTRIAQIAIGALGGAMVAGFGAATKAAAEFIGIIPKGGGWGSLFKMGPAVLGVVALAVALEDVYTWLTGGESVIGDFFDAFLGKEESAALLASMQDAFKGIGEALVSLGPPLASFLKVLLDLAVKIAPLLAHTLAAVLKIVTGLISGIVSGVEALITLVAGDITKLSTREAFSAAVDRSKKGFAMVGDAFTGAPSVPSIPAPPPSNVPAQGPATVEQQNQITINVANPGDVRPALRGALGDSTQQAAAAFGGGQ